MTKEQIQKNELPVISSTKTFINAINKTVPTEQERLNWQKLSALSETEKEIQK